MLVPTFCRSGSTLLSSVMLLKHLIQFDLENDAMCDKYGKFSIQVNAARLKPLGLPTARAHDIMPKLLNDVTTDAQNPPQYSKAQIGDMSEQNKKQILETYPDLKPLRFPFNDQATVFGAMLAAAKEMPRWQLTHQDQAQGLLEGVATTAIMRFKDDFVFVCKQDSAGNTVVHGRSKSRLGSSDFGANANRIQQYFKMVEAHLQ